MIVFRLSKSQFANDLVGKGAEKVGGRWNSSGVAILYTGQSRALCTTEIAVHTPLGILPTDYVIISIEIPDDIVIDDIVIEDLGNEKLPTDWKSFPHAHSTQEIGDEFVSKGKSAILKVPSVVVPGEYNYLINYNHPESKTIKIVTIEPFDFDERLFVK